jgi:hypothetical protein
MDVRTEADLGWHGDSSLQQADFGWRGDLSLR